jgi:hypothetical protein
MPADLDAVRRLALALPRTEERPSYNGTAGFRVRSRGLFAREREDGETIALKIDYGERRALTAMQPETFLVTAHYENYPWVIVRLATVDPGELEELLTEAWRLTASKRAVEAFDAERAQPS